MESTKNTAPLSASTSFVDCGEDNIKLEIKEEETLFEDPLSMEAENIKETIKQEKNEEIQDNYFLSCEQSPDENIIAAIDIVEHKIKL